MNNLIIYLIYNLQWLICHKIRPIGIFHVGWEKPLIDTLILQI